MSANPTRAGGGGRQCVAGVRPRGLGSAAFGQSQSIRVPSDPSTTGARPVVLAPRGRSGRRPPRASSIQRPGAPRGPAVRGSRFAGSQERPDVDTREHRPGLRVGAARPLPSRRGGDASSRRCVSGLTERRLCHRAARPAWGCVSVKSCYKVKGGGGGLRPRGRAQQRRQGGGRDAAAGPALRFPGRLGEPGAVTGRGPGSPAVSHARRRLTSLPPLPPALS